MALPTTKTDLCNIAFDRIGAAPVTDAEITADTDPRAKKCNLHYEQTRDALQRSYTWRFNKERIKLASAWAEDVAYTTDMYVIDSSVWYKCKTAHTSTSALEPPGANWTTLATSEVTPEFGFIYQFDLPADYLNRRSVYQDNTRRKTTRTYSLKDSKLESDDATVDFVYSKRVTDVTLFDALYVEVLTLTLAKKWATAIAKDAKLEAGIREELKPLLSKARALDKQEQNTIGRNDYRTHNDARRSGIGYRIASQMGN